jgi:hypothetical protein
MRSGILKIKRSSIAGSVLRVHFAIRSERGRALVAWRALVNNARMIGCGIA